jgi:CheY-like chemotaxis protein
MERARLVVFEDDTSHQQLIEEVALIYGHEVVLGVDSLRFALEALQLITEQRLKIDAYILDANLGADRDGRDARLIAQRMNELGLPGLRIGYSAEPYPVPVDFDAQKDAFKAMDFISEYEK